MTHRERQASLAAARARATVSQLHEDLLRGELSDRPQGHGEARPVAQVSLLDVARLRRQDEDATRRMSEGVTVDRDVAFTNACASLEKDLEASRQRVERLDKQLEQRVEEIKAQQTRRVLQQGDGEGSDDVLCFTRYQEYMSSAGRVTAMDLEADAVVDKLLTERERDEARRMVAGMQPSGFGSESPEDDLSVALMRREKRRQLHHRNMANAITEPASNMSNILAILRDDSFEALASHSAASESLRQQHRRQGRRWVIAGREMEINSDDEVTLMELQRVSAQARDEQARRREKGKQLVDSWAQTLPPHAPLLHQPQSAVAAPPPATLEEEVLVLRQRTKESDFALTKFSDRLSTVEAALENTHTRLRQMTEQAKGAAAAVDREVRKVLLLTGSAMAQNERLWKRIDGLVHLSRHTVGNGDLRRSTGASEAKASLAHAMKTMKRRERALVGRLESGERQRMGLEDRLCAAKGTADLAATEVARRRLKALLVLPMTEANNDSTTAGGSAFTTFREVAESGEMFTHVPHACAARDVRDMLASVAQECFSSADKMSRSAGAAIAKLSLSILDGHYDAGAKQIAQLREDLVEYGRQAVFSSITDTCAFLNDSMIHNMSSFFTSQIAELQSSFSREVAQLEAAGAADAAAAIRSMKTTLAERERRSAQAAASAIQQIRTVPKEQKEPKKEPPIRFVLAVDAALGARERNLGAEPPMQDVLADVCAFLRELYAEALAFFRPPPSDIPATSALPLRRMKELPVYTRRLFAVVRRHGTGAGLFDICEPAPDSAPLKFQLEVLESGAAVAEDVASALLTDIASDLASQFDESEWPAATAVRRALAESSSVHLEALLKKATDMNKVKQDRVARDRRRSSILQHKASAQPPRRRSMDADTQTPTTAGTSTFPSVSAAQTATDDLVQFVATGTMTETKPTPFHPAREVVAGAGPAASDGRDPSADGGGGARDPFTQRTRAASRSTAAVSASAGSQPNTTAAQTATDDLVHVRAVGTMTDLPLSKAVAGPSNTSKNIQHDTRKQTTQNGIGTGKQVPPLQRAAPLESKPPPQHQPNTAKEDRIPQQGQGLTPAACFEPVPVVEATCTPQASQSPPRLVRAHHASVPDASPFDAQLKGKSSDHQTSQRISKAAPSDQRTPPSASPFIPGASPFVPSPEKTIPPHLHTHNSPAGAMPSRVGAQRGRLTGEASVGGHHELQTHVAYTAVAHHADNTGNLSNPHGDLHTDNGIVDLQRPTAEVGDSWVVVDTVGGHGTDTPRSAAMLSAHFDEHSASLSSPQCHTRGKEVRGVTVVDQMSTAPLVAEPTTAQASGAWRQNKNPPTQQPSVYPDNPRRDSAVMHVQSVVVGDQLRRGPQVRAMPSPTIAVASDHLCHTTQQQFAHINPSTRAMPHAHDVGVSGEHAHSLSPVRGQRGGRMGAHPSPTALRSASVPLTEAEGPTDPADSLRLLPGLQLGSALSPGYRQRLEHERRQLAFRLLMGTSLPPI